jgi:hypothetical protein
LFKLSDVVVPVQPEGTYKLTLPNDGTVTVVSPENLNINAVEENTSVTLKVTPKQ